MSDSVKPLAKRHAAAMAALHREAISTGFLSSLGSRFLRQLYGALPSCPSGFGWVWEEPDGAVSGFIACAESTGRVYKQALARRGPLMGLAVLPHVIRRPSTLARLWETWRYPAETGQDLPPAEVLSVAVAASARGRGVGRALMRAAADEFRRRGIRRVKVAVGRDNEAANAFYRRCGFALALTREHHGLPMCVYVCDLEG